MFCRVPFAALLAMTVSRKCDGHALFQHLHSTARRCVPNLIQLGIITRLQRQDQRCSHCGSVLYIVNFAWFHWMQSFKVTTISARFDAVIRLARNQVAPLRAEHDARTLSKIVPCL